MTSPLVQSSHSYVDAFALHGKLRPCPVCGSGELRDLFAGIQECQHCQLAFVNPLRPYRGEHESREYFLNDYLRLHAANRDNSLAERRAHMAEMRRYFQLPEHARLLDVGCALGFMLQEAKAAGWEAIGIETSGFAAEYASQHTECQVYQGTLQQVALPSESFDVVTLMDVLEHIAEPLDLMREIYRVLRPGGIVYVVTPNFGSFFVRLYGPQSYAVWPDQHVVYFRRGSIKQLLLMCGFRRVVTGTRDVYEDNLKRLLRRPSHGDATLKAAFGRKGRLGGVRQILNRLFMHISWGDKLIALAQK